MSLPNSKSQNSFSMKHSTSTPSVVSTSGQESQNFSSVEWLPKFDCHLQQQNSIESKVHGSLLFSSETRRVSTSSTGSNERISGLSCISSSESSSSLGYGSLDGSDDTIASSSSIGDDDPIISLEALSLDTLSVTLGATTIPMSGRTRRKGKPNTVVVEDEQDQQHKEEANAMNRPLESGRCSKRDSFALSRRLDSFQGPLKGQIYAWTSYNSVPNTLRPQLSSNSSASSVAFPKVENDHHQQRRTMGKKYTVKMRTTSIQTTFINGIESPKALRSKRQRGGSDLSMASANSIVNPINSSVNVASSSCRRKRRRINRNRAMAADDFDSILSQIHTGGLCEGIDSIRP